MRDVDADWLLSLTWQVLDEPVSDDTNGRDPIAARILLRCPSRLIRNTYKTQSKYYNIFRFGSSLGQGVIAPHPNLGLSPQLWHKTLFDKLEASAYRFKKERSEAGLQNTPKCISSQGSAPDHTRGTYDGPPDTEYAGSVYVHFRPY